jgi:nuclear transport factor 2 (NTF2) superfamily protein
MKQMRESPERSFDERKTAYFSQLAMRVREALKLHKDAGLWERKDGERDWGNVSEHCLVEAARVEVLADKFGLPEDVKRDLILAAAAHDFFKKGEKEIVSADELSWNSFEKASEESSRKLREAGFNERIVRLVNSVGHASLPETASILEKATLSEDDLAYLVQHYVDDYTVNSEWSKPVESTAGGESINDLDRRVDKNEANERYARMNEEGKTRFSGETSFQAQRRIGHLVEEKLASLLEEKTGQKVDAKELPEVVDMEIRSKIEMS